MSEIRFPLPDVGEGLTEAEIVQWHVAPGDRIALNQVFVEIETAKSLVELPSAFEGIVSRAARRRGQDGRRRHADPRDPDGWPRPPADRRRHRRRPALRAHRTARTPSADRRVARGRRRRRAAAQCSSATAPRARGHASAAAPSPGGAHENFAAVPPPAAPPAAPAPSAPAGAPTAGRRGRHCAAAPRPESHVPVIAKPPDPQAREGPRRRPRRASRATGPIGDITRDDVIRAGEPGERLPQHPDARVADRSRGAASRSRACARPSRTRWCRVHSRAACRASSSTSTRPARWST